MARGQRCFTTTVLLFLTLPWASILLGGCFVPKLIEHRHFAGDADLVLSAVIVPFGLISFMCVISFFKQVTNEHESVAITLASLSTWILLWLCRLGVGVAGFVQRREVNDLIVRKLNESLLPENQPQLDQLQLSLHCCGLSGPNTWAEHATVVPDSCCTHVFPNCSSAAATNDSQPSLQHSTATIINQKGCVAALQQWITHQMTLFSAISVAISVLEVGSVVSFLCDGMRRPGPS